MAKENRRYFEVMIVEIMLNKTDLRQLKYYEERDFFHLQNTLEKKKGWKLIILAPSFSS